jgi:energy-converting hydrogenase Eha subunit E
MTVSFGLILAILILSWAWRRWYIMFTLYILWNSIWWYADYLMWHTDDYLDIWRQYNIINILNPYFFYLYAQTLSHKFHKQLNIFFGGVGSMLIFLNYYRNILIPDSIVELTWYELFKNIFSYNVLALYALWLYWISALWIYKNYKSSKKIVKILIVLGAILTTIGEFVSYSTVYSEITYSIPYLDLSFVFPYLITYLVLKHRLFDARSSLLHLLRWIFIYWSWLILVSLMGWWIMVFSHREIVYNLDLVFLVAIFAITTKLLAKSHWIRRRFQISDLVKLEKSVQEFLTSSSVYTHMMNS